MRICGEQISGMRICGERIFGIPTSGGRNSTKQASSATYQGVGIPVRDSGGWEKRGPTSQRPALRAQNLCIKLE